MQVGATPDLVVAYIDFFLGGDEKRLDMVTSIQKRFPMCIIFGGSGSYMSPYNLHSDTLLTNLIGQVFFCDISSVIAKVEVEMGGLGTGSRCFFFFGLGWETRNTCSKINFFYFNNKCVKYD